MKLTFISKNPFETLSLQNKVMDKIERGCLKMSKKMSLLTPLSILSLTFDWSIEISNGFLEMEFSLN